MYICIVMSFHMQYIYIYHLLLLGLEYISFDTRNAVLRGLLLRFFSSRLLKGKLSRCIMHFKVVFKFYLPLLVKSEYIF